MTRNPSSPLDGRTPSAKITEALDLDRPLHSLGFEYSHLSPEKITGHLTVTDSLCLPVKRMHDGVGAFVAEGVASAGAYLASGFQRVAGVQLSINYTNSAFLGDLVEVEATPTMVGNTIQVWEVQQWRTNPSISNEKVLLSTSRITLQCNLPSPKGMKSFEDAIKMHAKL